MDEPRRLCICGHSEAIHGDRIFGICSVRQYPNECRCTGFVYWDQAAEQAARQGEVA